MRMSIFLTGNHFVDSDVNEEQAENIIKSFDSPSCTRIVVSTKNEIIHIAKKDIVAIMIAKDKPTPRQFLN